jgi:hypothetical protein
MRGVGGWELDGAGGGSAGGMVGAVAFFGVRDELLFSFRVIPL